MALRLYHCDRYEIPLPAEHKFPMRKYRLLREALEADSRFTLAQARFAEREELELVHDDRYVASFLKGMLEPVEMRRIGFPWSEKLVRRTLASVGGTIEAGRSALTDGFAGNLAGGTHHAFADAGAGFCVFNDIAVAIRCLQDGGVIGRAGILDLDVHQGDGTAAIFESDPTVLTVSVHGANNFPFHKRDSKVDVALPDGADDGEFLAALEEVIPRLLRFEPEIVFYQSGVDGLASDALGRLALTLDGLAARDRTVLEACRDAGIPVAATLGGGYAKRIEDTVEAHRATFACAAGLYGTG